MNSKRTALYVVPDSLNHSGQKVPARNVLTARTRAATLIGQVIRRAKEARTVAMIKRDGEAPPGFMTFDQVRTYLGHERFESTEVWLSRHKIKPMRLYSEAEVREAREPNKVGTKTK